VAFSILMGLSRAYLGAHWLSDATAGILLGTSCALLTALVAGLLQERLHHGLRPPARKAPLPSLHQTTQPPGGHEPELPLTESRRLPPERTT
jgi:hypothetical protein